MPDKVLELSATMNDRVSDTLRQIKRSVDDLNKSTINLTTQKKDLQALGQELTNLGRAGQGIQQTTRHLRDFIDRWKEVGKSLGETGKSIAEKVVPGFEELGLGVTSVGAAAGLLVKTLKDVATESQRVQNIAKLSGLDAGSVAAMQVGVRAFGLSADKVISIMSGIAKQMDLMAGTPGGSGSSLLTAGRRDLGQRFAQDMMQIARNPDITVAQRNMQGIKRTLEELQRVQRDFSTQRAANIAEDIGLDRETILLISQGVDVLDHWRRMQQRMGAEIDPGKLKNWALAQDDLASSLEGLKRIITSDLLGDMTKITNVVADFVDKNKEEIGHGVADTIREIAKAAKESLPDLQTIRDVIGAIQQFNAASPGSAAQRSATWVREHGGQQAGDFLKSVPGSTPVLPGVNRLRGWFGGSPLPSTTPPSPAARFGESGVPSGAIDQAAMFPRGSLGTGNITTGWRRSTGIEDKRSNEEIVADQESHASQEDNTAAQRDNTEQLRKLIDILNRGHSTAIMDVTGGMGAGGMGGGFGAGQGPMYRPGVGPGTRARPGVTNAPGGPSTNAPQPRVPGGIVPYAPGTAPTVHDLPTPGTPAAPTTSGQPSGPVRTVGPDGGIFAGTPTTYPRSDPRAPDYQPPAGTSNAPAAPHDNTPKSPVFKGADPSTFGVKKAAPGLPGLQQGGTIRDPATVVDNRTGQPVARVAETSPELVRPLSEDPAIFGPLGGPKLAANPIAANIRFRNPGAMWPGQAAFLFGGERSINTPGAYQLPDKNWIAKFPTAQQGYAAQIWLMQNSPLYANKTVGEQQSKWSNGGRSTLPGYDPGEKIGPDSPKFHEYMNATATYEAGGKYPLTEEQRQRSFDIAALASGQHWNYDPSTVPAGGYGSGGASAPDQLAGIPHFTPGQLNNTPQGKGGQIWSVPVKPGPNSWDPLLFDPNATKLSQNSVVGPDTIAFLRTMIHPPGPGQKRGTEDTQALKQFVRSQGVDFDDNYCADLVTAAERRAAGQSPAPFETDIFNKHYNAAANMLSLPNEIKDPTQIQPGDIAINTRSYKDRQHIVGPGELGGHATFVGDAPDLSDPKHPMFNAVGGNQGGEHRWPAYDDQTNFRFRFFRPGGGLATPTDAKVHTTDGSNVDDSVFSQTSMGNAPGALSKTPTGLAKPDVKAITGQQPLMIPGEMGKPRWKPGQGGQTNVPANEQLARLVGMPQALQTTTGVAKFGQNLALQLASTYTDPIKYAYDVARGHKDFDPAEAAQLAIPLIAGATTGPILGGGAGAISTAMKLLEGGGAAGLEDVAASQAVKQVMQSGIGKAALGGGGVKAMTEPMLRLVGGVPFYGGNGEGSDNVQPAGGLMGNAGVVHKVEGTGTINVNIKAPRGTNVNAESSGLFKKVKLNRGQAMEHADEHGQYAQ